MDLVNELIGKLGISADQAKGGIGLLLNTARDQLGEADYAEVQAQIPDADDMLAAAPNVSTGNTGTAGMLGGLGDLMGGLSGGDSNSAGNGNGGLGGMLGGVSDLLGGQDSPLGEGLGGMLGNLGQFSELLNGFQDLKMDTNTLQKFIPIVMQFIQQKGGDSIGNIVGKIFE